MVQGSHIGTQEQNLAFVCALFAQQHLKIRSYKDSGFMRETGIYGLSGKITKLATLGKYGSKLLEPTDHTG